MKTLASVSSKHLNQPEKGQILWFRSDEAELHVILDQDLTPQSFQITYRELNIRYRINEHLKVGAIDDLKTVTAEGALKPPASRLIRDEKPPTPKEVDLALNVIHSTPELDESVRKKIISILQSIEIH